MMQDYFTVIATMKWKASSQPCNQQLTCTSG